ncbi:hypothetical protein [Pseudomonas aeruginosa]|uniref:hypothetical protein n=1 Tax=Pseudomonas aeruginosa TaxID=287 RepID=UPI00132837E0|nr:hypothetical protein [Pseudomonas aeruginosa]MWB91974.1 hypothetical protein [Pseudomonas aeruginosa]
MKKTKYLLIALLTSAAFDVAFAEDIYFCGNHQDYDAKACQELTEFFANWKSKRGDLRKITIDGFVKDKVVSDCKMEYKKEMMEILGFFPNSILINKDDKDQCVNWESIAGISCQYYNELSAILPAHWSVKPFCEWQEDNQEIYDQYEDYYSLSDAQQKERNAKLRRAEKIYSEKFNFLYKQNGAGLYY